MGEEELYKQAIADMRDLAIDVIEQCLEFARENDYDQEWVLDRFQESFTWAKNEIKKRKL